MPALDVSKLIPNSSDSPELAAYKQKVREVAKQHSASYHCGEYRSVLRKLDIKEEKKVVVKVTTTHPFEFQISILPSLLNSKSEDEQKELLIKEIGTLSVLGSSGKSVMGNLVLPASSIVSMELIGSDTTAITDDVGWFYVSDQGRVMHYFERLARAERADLEEGGGHRNVENLRSNYNTSICGTGTYYASKDSTRSTGNVCQRCSTSSRR